MRAALVRLAAGTEFGYRRSLAVLLLILLLVGAWSVLFAVAQPFWYDEICTVIVCHLPGASGVWKALDSAADTNPPAFYFFARLTRRLVPDDHLGYRLPSILGLMGTVLCIFVILSKRVSRLSALTGAAFVLCTPLAAYAYEARPYALMVGCISCAILAWQRIGGSWIYSLPLAASLAVAVSLHYYAIFVWPAFVLAEMSVLIFHRRLRISAWASFLLGAAPLLLFAKLLLRLREYYGQSFWSQPSFMQVLLAHNWFFIVGSGWTFTVGVAVLFLYFSNAKTARIDSSDQRRVEGPGLVIEEQLLVLTLLALPVIAVLAAKLSHGGMNERYMLPTILGGALAFGYVIDQVPSLGRVLVLFLLLLNYAASSVSSRWRLHGEEGSLALGMSVLKGSLLEPRAAAAHAVSALAERGGSDLPIVIASGIRYLPMAYYAPADVRRRLYAVVDSRAALGASSTASVDLALLVLRRYFPLQVEDYAGFASRHPEFLLVLGGAFDSWPERLAREGYSLRLVSAGEPAIYQATLKR